ncbi:MAG: hypothetical protein JWQ84_1855 [Mucilaginibacter sp.]|nr:hypothetical protein [Mucilaginibacter sp.]
MLSIRNIIKQYAGHTALSDVSLEVKADRYLACWAQTVPVKPHLSESLIKLQRPTPVKFILMVKN